jgi:hypothetical protein
MIGTAAVDRASHRRAYRKLRRRLHLAAAEGTSLEWRLEAVDEDQSIAIAVGELYLITASECGNQQKSMNNGNL